MPSHSSHQPIAPPTPSQGGQLTAATVHLSHRADWGNSVDAAIINLSATEGLSAQRTASWISKKSMWEIDSLDQICSLSVSNSVGGEVLYRTEHGLVQIHRRGTSLGFRIAAATQAQAELAEALMRDLLPPQQQSVGWDGKIDVRLWSAGETGPSYFTRTLEVPLLDEIEANYSHVVLHKLQSLRSFTPPPDRGRLVLLHGEPGTGKSHAVLSLGGEWRSWADINLITDPERLLRDPNYLMTVMGGGPGMDDFMSYTDPTDEFSRRRRGKTEDRWKIIVLEDAGEFMSMQARAETGQALSRLLNMTDGIIGTASRAMLIITTNERLGDLHPAVSRPGRCHMEVDFGSLEADQIAAWCQTNKVDETPRAQRMTLAELFAWKRGDRPVADEQSGFGFAA
jgi:hypothetical protein